MLKIFSKMENTYFDGILIKKGVNFIDKEDLKELIEFNIPFAIAFNGGYITIKDMPDITETQEEEETEPEEETEETETQEEEETEPEEETEETETQEEEEETIDFDSMNYQQLLKYVKINNIPFVAKNKAALLKAIKESL